ncbi:MAG: tRNA modification GTPase MnmE [Phycisphaerae bacterium]|nr:tRNA modification GTPase MnmE [Phycisphaerae bacterium]
MSQAAASNYYRLCSPLGTGGICLIEVLGPTAWPVVQPFLFPSRALNPVPVGQEIFLCRFQINSEFLDQILITVDHHNDVQRVLISAHGGVHIAETIMESLSQAGAILADSLPADEYDHWSTGSHAAIALQEGLLQAQTTAVAQWLLRQPQALEPYINQCCDYLPGDDYALGIKQLTDLAQTYAVGYRLIHGAEIALVGLANAGKSTLANCLFDQPWSIEHSEAGTTRDWVSQPISIRGAPLRLVDTAGIRNSPDELEQQAIQSTLKKIQQADLLVFVLDHTHSCSVAEINLCREILQHPQIIFVLNKVDLISEHTQEYWNNQTQQWLSNSCAAKNYNSLMVSAIQVKGIDALRDTILERLQITPDNWPCPAIWDAEQLKQITLAVRQAYSDPLTAARTLSRIFLSRR